MTGDFYHSLHSLAASRFPKFRNYKEQIIFWFCCSLTLLLRSSGNLPIPAATGHQEQSLFFIRQLDWEIRIDSWNIFEFDRRKALFGIAVVSPAGDECTAVLRPLLQSPEPGGGRFPLSLAGHVTRIQGWKGKKLGRVVSSSVDRSVATLSKYLLIERNISVRNMYIIMKPECDVRVKIVDRAVIWPPSGGVRLLPSRYGVEIAEARGQSSYSR